jgi:hypothetical protein
MNWAMVCNNPNVLRRFRADELRGLAIEAPVSAQFSDDGERIVDDALVFADHCKNLQWLHLTAPVSERGLSHIAIDELPHLQTLIIEHPHIDGAGLSHFKVLRTLQTLDLWYMTNLLPLLKKLRDSTALHQLSLDYCSTLKDSDVQLISEIPNLSVLSLTGDSGLTERCLPYITKLKSLQKLRLTHDKIDDAAVQDLFKRMPKLLTVALPNGTHLHR